MTALPTMQVSVPMNHHDKADFPLDKELLQQKILLSLSSNPGDSTVQCRCLQPLLESMKKEACELILYNLVQLNFTRDNACKHWDAIVKHAETMQNILNRKVGLATAACDYFSTVEPYLNNPKLIEFKRYEETLKSARHDFLTGLLSRGAFQDLFDQEMSRATRHNHNTTLIFLDLDNFKETNDLHGHLAGDSVLRQVGEIIINSKRKEDLACRFGGDEFVILLPETNKFMGLLVGKKLLDQINTLVIHHGEEDISVTCSGGLASFPLDSRNGKELLFCADRALYQAKSRGKHELNLFAEEKRVFTRIHFEQDITIRPLGNSKEDGTSKSKNLSECGILISSSSSYHIGTLLELTIPIQKNSILTITGSVVRVEQFDTDLFDIGLSFLQHDSNSDTTKAIADHIIQQLAQ
ncbi:diguanylate cyclase (GGDEF) domain-containing protein [Desulfocapsa sulfexigens DSM 10523]|uniref:diguanylate cyclase n=2 Tax=Desulfocapsa TaxID=53318 RepID=M1PB17_DESSD|nr:diguanylate cyclase (GGDEF) domain-containing protein [Desulfocapsa sulfexigens DSM 10523]